MVVGAMRNARRRVLDLLEDAEAYETSESVKKVLKQLGIESSELRSELINMFSEISKLILEASQSADEKLEDVAKKFDPIHKRLFQIENIVDKVEATIWEAEKI